MSRQRSRRKALYEEIKERVEKYPGSIRFIQQKPWTFVTVSFCRDYTVEEESLVSGYGFSKVCHPDIFDAEFGVRLATKRAIYDAVGKMIEMEDSRAEDAGEMEFVAPLMVPVGDVQTVG